MEVSDGSHGCSTLRACKFDDGIRTASRTRSLPNNYDLSALFYVPSDVLLESTPPSDLSMSRQYYFRSSSLCMRLDRLWFGPSRIVRSSRCRPSLVND